MKTAVVFSSYVPSQDKLWVGQEILGGIKSKIGDDCQIFAGVNPPVLNEWLDVLRTYTSNIEITPERLVISSDASAFQSALRAYQPHTGKFDLIIFLHTKGIVSKQHRARKERLGLLLGQYGSVKEILSRDDLVGSYGHTLIPVAKESEGNGGIWETLDRYCEWKCKPFKWFLDCSMFAMKAHILDSFLAQTNDQFLNSKLTTVMCPEGDRYFFERDFGCIVSRQGYIQKYHVLGNVIRSFIRANGNAQGPKLNALYQSELETWAINNGVTL